MSNVQNLWSPGEAVRARLRTQFGDTQCVQGKGGPTKEPWGKKIKRQAQRRKKSVKEMGKAKTRTVIPPACWSPKANDEGYFQKQRGANAKRHCKVKKDEDFPPHCSSKT